MARVVIVGGGVSGCACGASLATRGIPVTIVSSALDVVGLPSYGPLLGRGEDCVARVGAVLERLPNVLRDVWVSAAFVPAEGRSCVAVDRRMVSVETKRALEGVKGLEFRQGLIEDVRVRGSERPAVRPEGAPAVSPRRFEVETAFGEVLEADVLVLAPGLGMGGCVAVGEERLAGGRYGETPADGLRRAVERLGARWQESRLEVGARYGMQSCIGESGGARGVRVQRLGGLTGRWPAAFPEAPYWQQRLWDGEQFLARGGAKAGNGRGGSEVDEQVLLVPDGLASGERYACEWKGESSGDELGLPSRLPQEVGGLWVGNLDDRSRLWLGASGSAVVWFAGRASGARDYLESLESGARVADDIAGSFGRGVGVAGDDDWRATCGLVAEGASDVREVGAVRGAGCGS